MSNYRRRFRYDSETGQMVDITPPGVIEQPRQFVFKCSACEHSFTAWGCDATRTIPCEKCGATACRQITPVRIDRSAIALTTGASPESVAHFERVHREQREKEERSEREHGDYGTAPGGGGGISRDYKPVNPDDYTLSSPLA